MSESIGALLGALSAFQSLWLALLALAVGFESVRFIVSLIRRSGG